MKDDPSSAVQTENRRLAAIMFTDIVGFSRQMGADEARTLRLLEVHNQSIQQAVAAHHGMVIKTVGDAFLVDFPSVVHAVQCAQQIQTQFRTYNTEKDPAEQIHVRIGIHLGDIVQKDGDVFGDGVNIASRLQGLAAPDTICLSQAVYKEIEKKLTVGTVVSLGRPKLKNIAQQEQVYALLLEPPKGFWQRLHVQRLKFKQWRRTFQVVAAMLVLGWAGVVTLRSFSPTPPRGRSQEAILTEPQPVLPLPDKPSIIVLPFVNMSQDPGQEYFSDGITEDLTTDLSKLSGFFVIARNSAFTYKGKAVKVQDVSREMGVRYVLEGSVRKVGEQVRITAQLIDATTGGHLWSQRYDRPLKDIFAVQDEIVQQLVNTLRVEVYEAEQERVRRIPTTNLTAYDSQLRGWEYFLRFTKEGNAQARQIWEQAVELDSQYALAYVLLGWTHYMEWLWRWSPDPQNLERAFALVQQALMLDDSLPIAHGLLGYIYAQKQQYDQAIAEEKRAVALDPNYADAYGWQAEVLNYGGRPEEALQSVEHAMRLNPRYPPWYLLNFGWACNLTGRYAEATAALQTLLLRSPNFLSAYTHLANSYMALWGFQLSHDPQTLEQALTAAQKAVALNDSLFWTRGILGNVYLWQKQYEQAIAERERAVAFDSNTAEGYAFLAETLSRVGRAEEALRAAEQAQRLKPLIVDYHLYPTGIAYALAGRPEEAIAPLKQYLTRYPNILGAHLTLAAVYSELGKEAEARAEAAEVVRINPQFSLEVHKQRVPIKDSAMLERHIAALRKAGLK